MRCPYLLSVTINQFQFLDACVLTKIVKSIVCDGWFVRNVIYI